MSRERESERRERKGRSREERGREDREKRRKREKRERERERESEGGRERERRGGRREFLNVKRTNKQTRTTTINLGRSRFLLQPFIIINETTHRNNKKMSKRPLSFCLFFLFVLPLCVCIHVRLNISIDILCISLILYICGMDGWCLDMCM